MVPDTDTGVDHGAVVVELNHTGVAEVTVGRQRRSHDTARVAVTRQVNVALEEMGLEVLHFLLRLVA